MHVTSLLSLSLPISPGPRDCFSSSFSLAKTSMYVFYFRLGPTLPRSSMVKGSWNCCLTNRGKFENNIPVTHGMHGLGAQKVWIKSPF